MRYQKGFSVMDLKKETQLEKDLKRRKNGEFYLEPYNYPTQLSLCYLRYTLVSLNLNYLILCLLTFSCFMLLMHPLFSTKYFFFSFVLCIHCYYSFSIFCTTFSILFARTFHSIISEKSVSHTNK